MEETKSNELKDEVVGANETNVALPIAPSPQMRKGPEAFFASLNQLAKTLDSEISELESNVGRKVSIALSSGRNGEFAAPIADDIHDELQDINRLVI